MYNIKKINGSFIIKPNNKIDIDNVQNLIGRKFSLWTGKFESLSLRDAALIRLYFSNLYELSKESFKKYGHDKSKHRYYLCLNEKTCFDDYKRKRLEEQITKFYKVWDKDELSNYTKNEELYEIKSIEYIDDVEDVKVSMEELEESFFDWRVSTVILTVLGLIIIKMKRRIG